MRVEAANPNRTPPQGFVKSILIRLGVVREARCCGIVGCLGMDEPYKYLSEGVQILQNRGYDSAGICTINLDGNLVISKCASNDKPPEDAILKLMSKSKGKHDSGTVGIAHTRWATHGGKSDVNAHPHTDMKKNVAVVHNGTILNYMDLKAELESHGIEFSTTTDSEVIAQYIGYYCDEDGSNLEIAFEKVLNKLAGTWGLVVIHRKRPDVMMISRHGSPLVIGSIADAGILVASEPSAFAKYNTKFFEIEDMENLSLTLKDFGNHIKFRPLHCIHDADVRTTPYPWKHWTQREIDQQSDAIRNAMVYGSRLFINGDGFYQVRLGGLDVIKDKLLNLTHLVVVACGTSYHAGLSMQHLFRLMNLTDGCIVEDASDFEVKDHMQPKTGYLIISQSGETLDCVTAAESIKRQCEDPLLFSIVNVVGSRLSRVTAVGVYINAGREVAVASTKAFICQFVIGALISIFIGTMKNQGGSTLTDMCIDLVALPDSVDVVLSSLKVKISDFARTIKDQRSMFILGKGLSKAIALEGALKIKEISYIHAEGFSAGAMKHGPFALLDPQEKTPVISLIFNDPYRNLMEVVTEQVVARGANLVILTDIADGSLDHLTSNIWTVPTLRVITPILGLIPLQQLALELCLAKGLDPDKPRGLAKTVTVW